MANQQMYTQCRIERDVLIADEEAALPKEGVAKMWDEVWIPSEFATLGKKLSIRKEGGWERGWVVVFKGVTRSWESLKEYERDHLKQREASDI